MQFFTEFCRFWFWVYSLENFHLFLFVYPVCPKVSLCKYQVEWLFLTWNYKLLFNAYSLYSLSMHSAKLILSFICLTAEPSYIVSSSASVRHWTQSLLDQHQDITAEIFKFCRQFDKSYYHRWTEMDVNADYLRLLLLKKDSFKLQGFKNCVNDVRDQPLSQADVRI